MCAMSRTPTERMTLLGLPLSQFVLLLISALLLTSLVGLALWQWFARG